MLGLAKIEIAWFCAGAACMAGVAALLMLC
jgi:hypothetical protein